MHSRASGYTEVVVMEETGHLTMLPAAKQEGEDIMLGQRAALPNFRRRHQEVAV